MNPVGQTKLHRDRFDQGREALFISVTEELTEKKKEKETRLTSDGQREENSSDGVSLHSR